MYNKLCKQLFVLVNKGYSKDKAKKNHYLDNCFIYSMPLNVPTGGKSTPGIAIKFLIQHQKFKM